LLESDEPASKALVAAMALIDALRLKVRAQQAEIEKLRTKLSEKKQND